MVSTHRQLTNVKHKLVLFHFPAEGTRSITIYNRLSTLDLLVLDDRGLLRGAQRHLGRQNLALLRGRGTADSRIVAVEMLGNFLEGRVTGLDVEEVDDGALDAEPDAL